MTGGIHYTVPVFVFNFDLFKLSAAILEKGLFCGLSEENRISEGNSSLGPWSVTSGGKKLRPFLNIPPLKLTKSDSNYMSLI